jgi:hypothetical protein
VSRSVGIFNLHTPQNPTSLRHVQCYPKDHWGVCDKDWGLYGGKLVNFLAYLTSNLCCVSEREREAEDMTSVVLAHTSVVAARVTELVMM